MISVNGRLIKAIARKAEVDSNSRRDLANLVSRLSAVQESSGSVGNASVTPYKEFYCRSAIN